MMVVLLREFGSVNHMAKEYAFSPMAKKPEENMPFGEVIMSPGFSTEREEPFLNDEEEDELWIDKANTTRKTVNIESILLLKYLLHNV